MASLETKHLVFVDESGCAPGQRLGYGYALRGTRCAEAAPLRPRGRLNLVGWMSASCGEAVTVPSKMTGKAFEQFVAEHLVPALSPGDIVVWDNATIHTTHASELIEATGACVLALPRYSPEFNAIEFLWSKLKHYLRKRRADTREAMKDALHAAAELITPDDMVAWIKHCGYSISQLG